MSDSTLRSAEGVILMALVASYVLVYAVKRFGRTRPKFNILVPLAVGFLIRILAVIAINASGKGAALRGGDETTFLDLARGLAMQPLGRGDLPHGPFQLQTIVFTLEIKLLDLSPTAIRMGQIGIAMLGLILIAVAVHDIAGPRAARLFVWIMAFEPSNVFFNSEIHKEPLMLLASGLVVYGGTKIWTRFNLWGVLPCALGGLIAIETRSYAGWFLVIAAVLLLLHAALRRLDNSLLALPIIYLIIGTAIVATPTVLHITSKQSLATLQNSQNYTTVAEASTSSGRDNLALESVNLSSRGAVIRNLPVRMLELIFRPFPWQVSDISQQLGALATILAIFGLWLIVRYGWRAKNRIALIAPFLYPLFFLWCAYSLSAGNAGTGFRYRSHIVVLGAAILVVLREQVVGRRVSADEIDVVESSAYSVLPMPVPA